MSLQQGRSTKHLSSQSQFRSSQLLQRFILTFILSKFIETSKSLHFIWFLFIERNCCKCEPFAAGEKFLLAYISFHLHTHTHTISLSSSYVCFRYLSFLHLLPHMHLFQNSLSCIVFYLSKSYVSFIRVSHFLKKKNLKLNCRSICQPERLS